MTDKRPHADARAHTHTHTSLSHPRLFLHALTAHASCSPPLPRQRRPDCRSGVKQSRLLAGLCRSSDAPWFPSLTCVPRSGCGGLSYINSLPRGKTSLPLPPTSSPWSCGATSEHWDIQSLRGDDCTPLSKHSLFMLARAGRGKSSAPALGISAWPRPGSAVTRGALLLGPKRTWALC